jgi:hypothetical protein
MGSPYLDNLLTRWTQSLTDLRKEAAFQKDLIEPLSLAAHGNRLAMRERRRRDLRRLEDTQTESYARWDERLNRVEEWKQKTAQLKEEDERLRRLVQGSAWLEKARRHQDAFSHRIEHRAVLLQADQQALHTQLDAWLMLLQTQETTLQELRQKAEQSEHPFYVSRARKEPEVDFVAAQPATRDSLGQELLTLRRSLNILNSRVHRALQTIEQRTSGVEILYEVHKQELQSELKRLEKLLATRREEILSDALIYESCRHLLRRLEETAYGLQCIEDIPKNQKRGFFNRLP